MRKKRCKSGKTRFASEVDAMLVVAKSEYKVKVHNNWNRNETRVYQCPHCKGWHTTSSK